MNPVVTVLKRLVDGDERPARIAGVVLVGVLALVLRLAAAADAYPVPGDGAHFVQFGTELAAGNPRGLSEYLSPAMVGTAALARKMGWAPAYVLQYAAVVFGTAAVVGAMLLAGALFRKWNRAVVVGLLAATNPSLVQYSISGFSEMPYVGLSVWGVLGFWTWLSTERGRVVPLLLGFAALGLGAYYKGPDASLLAAITLVFGAVHLLRQGRARRMVPLAGAAAVFAAVILPLCLFTYHRSGQFMPGTKGDNLYVGDSWDDSKLWYATVPVSESPQLAERYRYFMDHGPAKFIWKFRSELAASWVRHVAQSVRLLSDQLFCGPFRMGPGWLVLLLALAAAMAVHQKQFSPWWLPLCLSGITIAAISLCLVHDRLMIPSFVFLLLIVSDAILRLAESAGSRAVRAVAIAGFAAFLLKYALLSLDAERREWAYWRYPNMQAVGQALRNLGAEEDILMAQGPHIAIEFYTNHPCRFLELPCAERREMEEYARARNVTLIVVSDKARPHWPIARLFDGEPAPDGWRLLTTLSFPGDEAAGVPAESYRVYRSDPALPEGRKD